jgi:hypothetical protein
MLMMIVMTDDDGNGDDDDLHDHKDNYVLKIIIHVITVGIRS